MQRHLRRAAFEAAAMPFAAVPFKYSFRSAPIVLDAVDKVFEPPKLRTRA